MMFNLSSLLFRRGGEALFALDFSFSCKLVVLLPPASPPPPLHATTENFGEQEFAEPDAVQHVHAMTCAGGGGW